MKRIFVLIAVAAFVFSCKKDEVKVMIKSDVKPPVIANPTSSANLVITAANMTDSLTVAWSGTDYGVSTQITYQIEADAKCGTFTTPVILGTTVTERFSISYSDLNGKLINNVKLAPGVSADLQIRITSAINGSQKATSDVVVVKATPYADKPLALWLGENSASAPTLFQTSPTTYEGYHYFKDPTSFRFSTSPSCPTAVYGTDGAGKISSTSSTELAITHAGFYKLNVDTDANTFDTVFVATWGMIGTATPLAWDGSTAMTYNDGNGHWEGIIGLVPGALKFRANNLWDLNYGPEDINATESGHLITTNDAIDIKNSGTYLVSLDFTQSASPYIYKYTITPSSEVAEPNKLWLPGGYEGFNPAAAPTIYQTKGNANVFEGFVSIPSATGFKFTNAPDYSHTNYGDSGTPNKLSTDGTAPDINLGVAGIYKLKANISDLSYQTYLVNTWGIIGTATAGQWDSSTAMTYDAATQTWSITTTLANGALKFRANDSWDVNYGPAASNDLRGTLIETNDAISIQDAGTYKVTIDFTRAKAPYEYSYTVVKQ